MDNRILTKFRLSVAEKGLNLYGINVKKDGETVAVHRWRSDDRVCLFSVSKSFTSVAVGMAMDDGLLKLTDKIVSFFPEAVPDNASQNLTDMTVKDCLIMATGHEEALAISTSYKTSPDAGWIKAFMEKPVPYQPGTHYVYNNGATYMLSAIVQKLTGQKVRDYLVPRLFEPLGIGFPQWFESPEGRTFGFSGLFLKTEELAQFSQFLLNRGQWEGKQLVSGEYIDMAGANHIVNEGHSDPEGRVGYGFQFWRNTYPDSYRCDGMYGQYCLILPKEQIAVTVTAHEEQQPLEILRCVWADILPELV